MIACAAGHCGDGSQGYWFHILFALEVLFSSNDGEPEKVAVPERGPIHCDCVPVNRRRPSFSGLTVCLKRSREMNAAMCPYRRPNFKGFNFVEG